MSARRERTRRRPLLVVAVLVALASSMAVPASGAKAAKASTDAVLTPRRPWFHEHPEPITATVPESACTEATCPQLTVSIEEPVWRLRVGLAIRFPDADHIDTLGDPAVWPSLEARVTPPGGAPRYVTLGASPHSSPVAAGPRYHDELLWVDPPVGQWTITVIPTQARGVGFRLRAGVEELPEPPDEEKTLLPDLRAIPPFEIGLMTPTATYLPGAPAVSPRAGCMVEEVEEALLEGRPAPSSCLRVSLGVENAGAGPLRLKAPDDCVAAPHACTGDVPVTQLFYVRDPDAPAPTYWRLGDETHPAGTGHWHATHVHFHYGDMYRARLFRVDESGRQPAPVPAGDGHKLGFSPFDEWMADWHRFEQGPFDCCWHGATLSMSPGWGDVYEWNRSGNYVDFPTDALGRPAPGQYVLQGETDPDGLIRESDERNNRAYAVFVVSDAGGVTTVERGYGDGPWDPTKRTIEVTP